MIADEGADRNVRRSQMIIIPPEGNTAAVLLLMRLTFKVTVSCGDISAGSSA